MKKNTQRKWNHDKKNNSDSFFNVFSE